jgi:hypothetical protein
MKTSYSSSGLRDAASLMANANLADPELPALASAAHVALPGKAEDLLPELVDRMKIELSRL